MTVDVWPVGVIALSATCHKELHDRVARHMHDKILNRRGWKLPPLILLLKKSDVRAGPACTPLQQGVLGAAEVILVPRNVEDAALRGEWYCWILGEKDQVQSRPVATLTAVFAGKRILACSSPANLFPRPLK